MYRRCMGSGGRMSTNISKKKRDDLLEKTHRGKIDLIYIDIKTPRLIQFNYSYADFAA